MCRGLCTPTCRPSLPAPPRCGLLNAPVIEAKPFELWGGDGPLARSAKGVELTSSPSRRRMAGLCAKQPVGVDVKRPLRSRQWRSKGSEADVREAGRQL